MERLHDPNAKRCIMCIALRKVSDTSWILFGKLLISHHDKSLPDSPPVSASWSDGKDGFFTVADAPDPPPHSELMEWPSLFKPCSPPCPSPTPFIEEIGSYGYGITIWKLGKALLYARGGEDYSDRDTREHTTLEFLGSKAKQLGFAVPKVLYHKEFEDRHCLVTDILEGTPISRIWCSMDDAMRKKCASSIAKALENVARIRIPRDNGIVGVDYNQVHETHLLPFSTSDIDRHDPMDILATCDRFLDTDTTKDLVLCNPYHDMRDFIFNDHGVLVGIQGWDTTGFFPQEWLRSNGHLTWFIPLSSNKDAHSWRILFDEALEEAGFKKCDKARLKAWQYDMEMTLRAIMSVVSDYAKKD